MKQFICPAIGVLAFCFLTSCKEDPSENNDHFVIEQKYSWPQKPSSRPDSTRFKSARDLLGMPGRPITIREKLYYVVEGDRLLSEKEYDAYLLQLWNWMSGDKQPKATKGPALVGEIANGDTVRWPRNSILHYSINRKSFSHIPGAYQTLVETFAAATDKWEDACGIRFYHDDAQDGLNLDFPTDGNKLSFSIKYFATSGQYYALAFSTKDNPTQRTLKVDDSFFSACHDQTGIMAHEIGHILGFLHEPVPPQRIPLCPGEIPEPRVPVQIGPKDSESVMQMICEECLSSDRLKVTITDAKGAKVLYGEPKGLVRRVKSYFN